MTVRPRVPHSEALIRRLRWEFCWHTAWIMGGAALATWQSGLLRFLGLVILAMHSTALALAGSQEREA